MKVRRSPFSSERLVFGFRFLRRFVTEAFFFFVAMVEQRRADGVIKDGIARGDGPTSDIAMAGWRPQ